VTDERERCPCCGKILRLKRPTKYPQLGDAAWLEARYATGSTIDAIAQEVGCSYGAVRAAMLRFDIPRRQLRNGRLSQQHKDKIAQAQRAKAERKRALVTRVVA
jgi:hypothetical protein